MAPETTVAIQSKIQQVIPASIPVYYAIVGSRAYQTEYRESDTDVCGFHCVNSSEYLRLNPPESKIQFSGTLKSGNLTLDLISYEVKAFGRRCYESHPSPIEAVFADDIILNNMPAKIGTLRSMIQNVLPAELINRYEGISRSLLEEALDSNNSSNDQLNGLLYSIRAALAAVYVSKYNEVEPSMRNLACSLLSDSEQTLIFQLIRSRRDHDSNPDVHLQVGELADLIRDQWERTENTTFSESDRRGYGSEIDSWIVNVHKQGEKLLNRNGYESM